MEAGSSGPRASRASTRGTSPSRSPVARSYMAADDGSVAVEDRADRVHDREDGDLRLPDLPERARPGPPARPPRSRTPCRPWPSGPRRAGRAGRTPSPRRAERRPPELLVGVDGVVARSPVEDDRAGDDGDVHPARPVLRAGPAAPRLRRRPPPVRTASRRPGRSRSRSSYPAPLTPGEPPRTSIEEAAPAGKWKTVQPVGPSSYSATPISRPGKANSSEGPSNSVRGLSSAVSFVRRATGRTIQSARGREDARALVRSRRAGRRLGRHGRGQAQASAPPPARHPRRPRRLRERAVLPRGGRARGTSAPQTPS